MINLYSAIIIIHKPYPTFVNSPSRINIGREIRSFIPIDLSEFNSRFISLYPLYPTDYIVRLYIGLYRSNSCLAPAARGTHPRCRASGVLRLRR